MAPLTCRAEGHEPQTLRFSGGPRRPACRGESPPTSDRVAHLPWVAEAGAFGFAYVNDPHTPTLISPSDDNAFGSSQHARRTGTSSPLVLGADDGGGDTLFVGGRSPLRTKLDDVEMLALESKLQLVKAQRQLSAVRCETFLQDLEKAMFDAGHADAALDGTPDTAAGPIPTGSDGSAAAPAPAHPPRSPQTVGVRQLRRLTSVGSRSSNRGSSSRGRHLHRATSEPREECVGESPLAPAIRPLRPPGTSVSFGRVRSSSPCLAASPSAKRVLPSHSAGVVNSSIGTASDDACSSNMAEKQTSASAGSILTSPQQSPNPPRCSSSFLRTTSSPSLIGLAGSPSHTSLGQNPRQRRLRSLFPIVSASQLSPTSNEKDTGSRCQPMPGQSSAFAARGPMPQIHGDVDSTFQEASPHIDFRGGEVEWGSYSLTGSSTIPPHRALTGQRLRQQHKSRLHKSKRRTSFSFDDLDEICAYALREDACCPT